MLALEHNKPQRKRLCLCLLCSFWSVSSFLSPSAHLWSLYFWSPTFDSEPHRTWCLTGWPGKQQMHLMVRMKGFYLESRRHTAAPVRACFRLRRLWISSRGDDSYAVIPYWLWDNGHCIVQRGLVIFFASLTVFPLSWCISHVSAPPSLYL